MTTSGNEQFDRVLLDLNAVVIAILRDHPGHEYLFPPVERGFEAESSLLVFDYYPLRAQYLLTKRYRVETHRARTAVQRFVRQPIQFVAADRETILEAYEVSAERNHDVYDCFLVALARHHEADAILTTDTDFEELCRGEPFAYFNPVPEDILERFADAS
ncbi:type II toxin-antitoxin system VapC family toxin [Halomarina halobia]|uniref:Type II toxin-antitoxin system VapC family toxin n=1 Tax=Halomarina halobia TaxID=3033386 RepID=A0ABD6AC34_9EURY|nr:PIN domain-containing protein [Halomarina sp. PSR21]